MPILSAGQRGGPQRTQRTVALAYCTNAEPAEALLPLEASIDRLWRRVRERAAPDRSMGVGLWLPADLARELMTRPERAASLRKRLDAAGLACVTANAFPYGGFHKAVVKRDVYRPAWFDVERARHALAAARALALLLPEERPSGTVSSLPLAWGADFQAAGAAAALAGAFSNRRYQPRML